ncbi:PerC family transcriptional regulator [Citrobacter werkmanii]|jgi:hypothetical protein|uniref:PerC family transcriptional regulator n=1 Tax=Citrobacter werkmanii TaxID=67827 RepID=UPI0018FFE4A2|nr:PerC family transcriptional regulator [Citrobacter werkmanii]EGT0660780.1 PerC family transcriptional regulator [Citrobacter werkmanii]MBJ9294356.1 PerC family transcriptional regulator [Citrobacter werkmanii]MDO8232909.1 PerC family transcriptional regulator [Citrobacter werkmanii]
MFSSKISKVDSRAGLRDELAESLEKAGLWRRAATRWLHVFDSLESAHERERIALRREACLFIASSGLDKQAGIKRRKIYRALLKLSNAQ